MLSYIHIRDFAIIAQVELELYLGMTALTGETGAGKSILLDAIGLVLGDKADSGVVRHGAERAEISLGVDISRAPHAQGWLVEHGMASEDNNCILRRVITAQGKSRAWINGTPVSLTQLRELGEQLVDIHGQHAHQALMKREAQRDLLDAFADATPQLAQVRQAWQQWKHWQERLTRLSNQSQQQLERLELLRFQMEELAALVVQPDEWEQLDEELNRLAHAEQLRATAAQGYSLLYEAEPSLYSQLGRLVHGLGQQLAVDSRLVPAHELLLGAQIQIQEAATLLRDYADSVELDPERLRWVESRIADIRHVARKYRCQPDGLPARLQAIQAELAELDGAEGNLEVVEQQLQQAAEAYRQSAQQLSAVRLAAAQQLAAGVTAAMQELGMQGGQFAIAVQPQPDGTWQASGWDNIEFMVSANPGQPLKPLTKVASGGELSRISLAIQMMAAQKVTLPALIFDEVDTGIGGGIAEVVGRQLRALGENRQVLCVTHLPQVAARAHHHYKVSKVKGQDSTHTGIALLTPQQRVEEVARMVGGMEITPATLALAAELLA